MLAKLKKNLHMFAESRANTNMQKKLFHGQTTYWRPFLILAKLHPYGMYHILSNMLTQYENNTTYSKVTMVRQCVIFTLINKPNTISG
jgi:hypothetical protein